MTDNDLPVWICVVILGGLCGNALAMIFGWSILKLWEGLGELVYRTRRWVADRQLARQAALRAVADANRRAWFVKEMRANPNAFGGDHKPSEFREGE